MTYDVEHFFIYLSAICISPLVKYLSRSLVHFTNQIGLLLLSFKGSLYIQDKNLLSDESFANVFFQSMVCLLILFIVSFAKQKFLILMKSSVSIISFTVCAFGVVSKKSSPYPRSSWFLLYYFRKLSYFCILHEVLCFILS